MRKSILWLALSAAIALNPAQAQPADVLAVTPGTPEAMVDAATSASGNAVAETFNDWVSKFEQQFQPMGVAAEGRSFFSGQAAVKGSAQDAAFGKQLAMAYEQAMFDMRADFVLQHYGRLKAQAIRSLYDDSSSNRDEFPEAELESAAKSGGSRLESLLDKALTVVEKKLDSTLIEQGVPADEIQRISVDQKKTLYKDNLHKSIVKRAFHSMQGLVPVQTRIFTEDSGNGKAVVVGVIAVRSEKTQQFARDISRKRPSLVTGSPRALNDLLPADNSGYLDEIGLRFMYDEQGRPMLLSYGRTSVAIAPDWSPSRAFQARQNAQQQAQALAESGIVEFMNTSIQVEESNEVGSVEEEQLERITQFDSGKKGDVQDTRSQVAEAISIFAKSGRATAQGDLRGTSVVKRWEAKDENGVQHVGSVVTWTYSQLHNANAIDAQGKNQQSVKAMGAPGPGVDQSRSSRMVNDRSDF
ncbi:MAG TPA: hypothetical protein VL003_05360 [Pusillimonas sp.]|uniref:DUF6844 domain-containing protein n=1 Tax=Pusillimonas sp. TaxID=3040095 RepID=UPI002C1A7C81|nr:hypothetical protein [Pusillimonas sp.]HUH87464.1 hypothetical protein [Pusillimonas sp.]